MARKNPFATLMDESHAEEGRPVLDYTVKGASKSIISSIDEMAARADKLLEGQTVIELEPELIDDSFVRDRMEEDDEALEQLQIAIAEHGQDSPILVRPHPKAMGRYMVVFGHRRLTVARRLGRPVRAVVRELDDRAHIIAQGQENSARANLSFIERAIFARRLANLHYDNDNATVRAALALDKATLSKMLAVASIPDEVLSAIGAARSVGRDRWYEMKLLLEKPANLEKALDFVSDERFAALASDDRFEKLFEHLRARKKVAKAISPRNMVKWTPDDKGVSVDMKTDGKSFTFALKARDAVGFGEYLSRNLDQLYRAYKADRD